MWTFINTWNNMLVLHHLSAKSLLCSLTARHRSSAGHQMQQGKRVFRCRLLVLTRHQFAVDDNTRIIRATGPRIKRARFFENGLRKVRYQKSASEHRLQLPVAFQRVSGHTAAANPVGNISESDSAMADGSNNFVARPEIFERLRDIFVRKQIERRTTPTRDMNSVVTAQIHILQLQC